MRRGISISITRSDRNRLESITRDRNAPQKHVWRAAIVLLSADGIGTNAIMRQTGTPKTCVWRWQERFMQEGVDGLLRDKTRPSRIPPLGPEVADRVVALTLSEPPTETTDWTDPKFVDKLRDVVALYIDPPAHAIVLSVDEKSQIQALDRAQPGLPLKKGRLGTMTHDYAMAPRPCSPRSTSSTAPSSAATCSATATRSSSGS